MSKILCFGSICKDIFFPTEEGKILETPEEITSQKKIAFELGAKYKIEERHESLGGCAANVAVGLTRLGLEAEIVGEIGKDAIGEWVLKELKENKVVTDSVSFQEGKESSLSGIIVDKKSSDRVIFSNKNSKLQVKLNVDKIKEIEYVFLGDLHGKWQEEMEEIIQASHKENKKIILNPREVHIKESPAEILEAIGLSEVIFVNKDEAIEILSKAHGDFSLEEMNDEKFLVRKLLEFEPKVVVITDGINGAWTSKGERLFFAKGLKVEAVDSTGAGDAFLSGFLAAYIQNKELGECLKRGIANSASSVQYFGAIEGLLDEEKILEESGKVNIEEIVL